MNYIEELKVLENKDGLTSYDITEFEKKIKKCDLDLNMEKYVKNKISVLKSKLVGNKASKWDLFVYDISTLKGVDDLVSYLKKIDEMKDETIDNATLKELETEYERVILPILHTSSNISQYYRDLCIKEINKKLKLFHNRLDRLINPEFGKRIRELREAEGMSLKDLEYASGVTASYIHRIENGLRKPSVEKIEKLSLALHADFKELLDLLNIGFILEENKEKNEELLDVIKKNNFVIQGKQLTKQKNKILEKIIESILENDVDCVIENMEKLNKK